MSDYKASNFEVEMANTNTFYSKVWNITNSIEKDQQNKYLKYFFNTWKNIDEMNGYKRRNKEKESFINCRRIENWREEKFYFILNVKVACSGKNLFAAKKNP